MHRALGPIVRDTQGRAQDKSNLCHCQTMKEEEEQQLQSSSGILAPRYNICITAARQQPQMWQEAKVQTITVNCIAWKTMEIISYYHLQRTEN